MGVSSSLQSKQDLAAGVRVTLVGLVLNLLLIGLKLFGGIVGRSQALIADAVHSASDLFGDGVVLLGLKWGRKEADADHPYGHGKIETIAGFVVGLILLAAAGSIAYNAIASIYEHEGRTPSSIAIIVAVISIGSKEAVYWYTRAVGRRIRSTAVIANAWHHRTDALSSVAVLIGLIASQINPNWFLADSIAALVVSLFLMHTCWSLLWGALRELSDIAPERRILAELKERAARVPGVMQVHDLKARHSGPNLLVEMHVVVDGRISVYDGHEIAREVRVRLLEDIDAVSDVLVHLDPDSEMKDDEED
ncbi:cation diffusion facilitator family transporter [candidate division GN15 bacterium]|nr:cation diffusion facilitator family transporter [candidate division GN15 bacterium]